MAEEEKKKIIVDDDWKAEAKREKDRLAAEEGQQQGQRGPIPDPTFAELINIIVMQAMAALGLLQGPGGQRMPADPPTAKHFIDMLELIDQKTKGNLTDEEKSLLDQVLYETRMAFVQIAQGGGPTGGPPTPTVGPQGPEGS